jgi:hypothetical protein
MIKVSKITTESKRKVIVYNMAPSFVVSQPKFYIDFSLPHKPFRGVQIMKLFIT